MTTQFLSTSTIVVVTVFVAVFVAVVDVVGIVLSVNVVSVVDVVGIVLSVNVVPMWQLRSNEMPTEPKFFSGQRIFFLFRTKKKVSDKDEIETKTVRLSLFLFNTYRRTHSLIHAHTHALSLIHTHALSLIHTHTYSFTHKH